MDKADIEAWVNEHVEWPDWEGPSFNTIVEACFKCYEAGKADSPGAYDLGFARGKVQGAKEKAREILELIENWKQPRSTALECQGSHNEIVYVNILKEKLCQPQETEEES